MTHAPHQANVDGPLGPRGNGPKIRRSVGGQQAVAAEQAHQGSCSETLRTPIEKVSATDVDGISHGPVWVCRAFGL